jgi:hypothetical protein
VNLFDSILDITVGYPINIPQNELNIIKGDFPKEVHFHVKRHKSLDIPNHKGSIETWCQKVWKEKEEKLKKFYEEKKFDCTDSKIKVVDEREIQSLFKFANIFWTIFQISTLVLLVYAPIIRCDQSQNKLQIKVLGVSIIVQNLKITLTVFVLHFLIRYLIKLESFVPVYFFFLKNSNYKDINIFPHIVLVFAIKSC